MRVVPPRSDNANTLSNNINNMNNITFVDVPSTYFVNMYLAEKKTEGRTNERM